MKGKIVQVLKGYATDASDKPSTSIDYDRIDNLATDLEKLFSMHFVVQRSELLTKFRVYWWGNRRKLDDITNEDINGFLG